jgi:hypothetical protein
MNESGGHNVEFDMNDASKAARESRFAEMELWFIRHPELPGDKDAPLIAPAVTADSPQAAKSARSPAHDPLLP